MFYKLGPVPYLFQGSTSEVRNSNDAINRWSESANTVVSAQSTGRC